MAYCLQRTKWKVGLPEKVDGQDSCTFLESWLPQIFWMKTSSSSLVIKKTHQIPGTRGGHRIQGNYRARTLMIIWIPTKSKAATAKDNITYKEHAIRFYPDALNGVYSKQWSYNGMCQKLQDREIATDPFTHSPVSYTRGALLKIRNTLNSRKLHWSVCDQAVKNIKSSFILFWRLKAGLFYSGLNIFTELLYFLLGNGSQF